MEVAVLQCKVLHLEKPAMCKQLQLGMWVVSPFNFCHSWSLLAEFALHAPSSPYHSPFNFYRK